MNNEEKALEQIITMVTDMIIAGVLKKNIIRHFNNKGFKGEMIDKIIRIGEIRAQELCAYKIGKYSKNYNYAKQ